jgi:DNA-binding response OmpR family regulator
MESPTKKTVLMLDDERFLLDMYRLAFEKAGFAVITCRDADTALTALRSGVRPDAILFDITMPDGKSGFEFLDTIKHEHLATGARTIALTNAGADGVITRVVELGADAYLLKSDHLPSQLVADVERILS